MNGREMVSEFKLYNRDTLKTIQERYQTLIEQTNLIVFDINLKDHEFYISDNFLEQRGILHNEKAILKHLFSLKTIHPDDIFMFKKYLKEVNKEKIDDTLVYRRLKQDGKYAWIRTNRKNIFDKYGKLIRVLGTAQDVSSEMEAYEKMRIRAEKDALTDIPNLLKFTLEANEIINRNYNKNYAIIVFDIDKFRNINDLFGSKTGDGVLQHIGCVLKSNTTKLRSFCRMYADNFAILMEYREESELSDIACTLANEIAKFPLKLEVMLSFGVCKVDDLDTPTTILCDRASLAKKAVKGNVLKLLGFYDEALRQQEIEDQDIENEMNMALENHEFTMLLQPKVTIATTEVVGAEALVRWIHPTKGIISPDRFIPLFEKNGFIVKLDYYIWEKAFATIRKWIDEGITPIPISVNVSRLHIHNTDLIRCFVSLANKYQVPKHMIELELTETAFFDNIDEISYLVQALKKEGFILSMDDFGSGYSSLNMLKEVHVDVIKIDRGFMNEVVATERGKIVIRCMIEMAKQLNINVIAEGVENFYQVEFLYEAGCETAQGYFYSKPIPIDRFEQYTFGLYKV